MPKVLISDKLAPATLDIFAARGVEADFKPGLDKNSLAQIIGNYDGLAVRSATKVTAKLLEHAAGLKVIGRAGIGVDNIDLDAASVRGIIVMNAPLGNSITTAEHALALMMALARQIPQADRSTQSGKWEKSAFLGVELAGKTLGIVGCGNVGAIVARRAQGLAMKVAVYDPFLPRERAAELGVEILELDELLPRADFITLHTPLTDKTRHIINQNNIAKMKDGARLVNCARGGLIDEQALKNALESGKLAGAALDVFSEEPARNNILFGAKNIICTPHLGASTSEAQEKVALQIADQMSDYLLSGAVTHAVNMPSISAEEAPKLTPFIRLARQLGRLAGQILEGGVVEAGFEYQGEAARLNVPALTAAALAGLFEPVLSGVNMVSAPAAARARGVKISETRIEEGGAYESYIRLSLKTENSRLSAAGTVFSDGRPRLIQMAGIDMEAEFAPHMLYVANRDLPGFVGQLGGVLGGSGVNIASFNLGRTKPGGKAAALIAVDAPVPPETLKAVRATENVVAAAALAFQT